MELCCGTGLVRGKCNVVVKLIFTRIQYLKVLPVQITMCQIEWQDFEKGNQDVDNPM